MQDEQPQGEFSIVGSAIRVTDYKKNAFEIELPREAVKEQKSVRVDKVSHHRSYVLRSDELQDMCEWVDVMKRLVRRLTEKTEKKKPQSRKF